jgi:hypothetical protein
MASNNDKLDELVKEALAASKITKSNKGDGFKRKTDFAVEMRKLGYTTDPTDIDRRIDKLRNRTQAAQKDMRKGNEAIIVQQNTDAQLNDTLEFTEADLPNGIDEDEFDAALPQSSSDITNSSTLESGHAPKIFRPKIRFSSANSYSIFCREKSLKVGSQSAEMWKSLSEEEKSEYKNKALEQNKSGRDRKFMSKSDLDKEIAFRLGQMQNLAKYLHEITDGSFCSSFVGVDVLNNSQIHFCIPQDAEERLDKDFLSESLGSFCDQVGLSLGSFGTYDVRKRKRVICAEGSSKSEEKISKSKAKVNNRDNIKSLVREELNGIFSKASNGAHSKFPYGKRVKKSGKNLIEWRKKVYEVIGWPETVNFEADFSLYIKSDLAILKNCLENESIKIVAVEVEQDVHSNECAIEEDDECEKDTI